MAAASAAARPASAWATGSDEVEARSTEEGYEGARYLARIVEADAVNRRAEIEFYAFTDAEAPERRLLTRNERRAIGRGRSPGIA